VSLIGLDFPAEYKDFLLVSDGGEGFIGENSYAILWHLAELASLNLAYEVTTYAPGLFAFGSNGGGEAFAFDFRSPVVGVVSVPFVGMDLSLACPLAPTFDEFLEALFRSS
jgi:hypothetical protein